MLALAVLNGAAGIWYLHAGAVKLGLLCLCYTASSIVMATM